MARPLRNFVRDGIYHLTARGVDRLTIFRDDEDRERFLELVRKVVLERGWSCLGYCLMNNHYHLLIRAPEADVAAGMQYINGQFARYFNNRHGRTGHLFQGRYHHEVIRNDVHLLETARYIPLNPVRAGMRARAIDWKWSSHNAILGLVKLDWLDVKDLLARFAAFFGGNPRSPKRYEQFVSNEERRRRSTDRGGRHGPPGAREPADSGGGERSAPRKNRRR